MIIAHVLSSFGMGGQERVALDLARAQRADGHDVLAVSLAPEPHGPLAAEFAAHGVEVVGVAKRAGGIDPTLVVRLAALFRRRGVRVVHTHNPQPLIYGAPAAKLARAKAVHTKHGANPAEGKTMLLRRAAGMACDAYVAVSEPTAAAARAGRDVPERKLRVIPNGIDLSRFGPDPAARAAVRAELALPADAWVIGTVGRVAPEKDHALLVRAAATLLSDRVFLVIVGDGAELAKVRVLDGRVRTPGARRDVPRLLAAFDVFALSSKTEGLPLVLPEAMASALPIVATAVGGVPDVVREGETGHLVPAGDAAAFGAKLAALAADPDRARAMGRRARAIALDRYSAVRMNQEYMALYRSLLP